MFIVFGLVLVGVFALVFLNIYNGLVALKVQVERAWANIDVVLKQRFDEIPQLLQVIEQYVQYESDVLHKLIEARTKYGSAHSIPEKIEASQQMSLALKGVMAIGEAYPELKSNQNFTQLQNRVSALEGQIADRRELFNEAVANYNTRLVQFPDVIAANILGYTPHSLFKVSEEEKVVPSLKMNLPKFKTGA